MSEFIDKIVERLTGGPKVDEPAPTPESVAEPVTEAVQAEPEAPVAEPDWKLAFDALKAQNEDIQAAMLEMAGVMRPRPNPVATDNSMPISEPASPNMYAGAQFNSPQAQAQRKAALEEMKHQSGNIL